MSQVAIHQTTALSGKTIAVQACQEKNGIMRLPELKYSVEVDRSKPLPASLQNDFIPDKVLLALTLPPVPHDKLCPQTKTQNLNISSALARAPPANVWNHGRRERFRHLLDSTACSCGAGRDISFLYDVPRDFPHPEKPDSNDASAVRKTAEIPPKKPMQLPDTLIPEEYHVVKNRGVMGLEYHDDKYSTNPNDHEQHLVVFPSMKPSSRFEVMQLKKTMHSMLEKVGFNDTCIEMKGPTQIHNLLQLIKKEQDIYNIVFHELIRQTSVECVDRGQLLAEVRTKYSDLLSKVPKQIMSLHEEVLAQRALDRRLTDELMKFKNTIAILTSELTDVKERDRIIAIEAGRSQGDLRQAIVDAQKNSSLLFEYHELYELQRHRLERQVSALSEEREMWSTAAYCLALKVIEDCKMTTVKRLLVSEKSWMKLSSHFTVLLGDRDTDLLTHVQKHVHRWQQRIKEFDDCIGRQEENIRDSLNSVKKDLGKWILDFQKNCFNIDGRFEKAPLQEKIDELHADIVLWTKVLSSQSEAFGGELMLSNEEQLSDVRKMMEGWTDESLTLCARHNSPVFGTVHTDRAAMSKLNEDVLSLLEQYHHRITGENGVVSTIIKLQSILENWKLRLASAVKQSVALTMANWSSFYQAMDKWVTDLSEATSYIGDTQTEDDRRAGRTHHSIDVHDVAHDTQKWATTFCNSIENEDCKLIGQVSSLHSDMVRWMAQILIRLAPNKEDNSAEASQMALLGNVSIAKLHENAKALFQSLASFSNHVYLCCDGIVKANIQRRLEGNEENADLELKDLENLRAECEDWIQTAQSLLCTATGETVQELFPELSSSSTHLALHSHPTDVCSSDHRPGLLGQQELSSSDRLSENRSPSATSMSSSADAMEIAAMSTRHDDIGLVERDDDALDRLPRDDNDEVSGSVEVEKQSSGLCIHHHVDFPEAVAESDTEREGSAVSTVDRSGPVRREESVERMEFIGGDDNTHRADLTDKCKQGIFGERSQMPVTATGAPDTRKAFEALAAVSSLQEQLIATELRAQRAEERAVQAEADLLVTEDTVRSLRKQLKKFEYPSDDSYVGVPSTSNGAGVSLSVTNQLIRTSQQSSSSDRTKTSDLKKKEFRTKPLGKPKRK